MTLANNWKPRAFWVATAKLFDVSPSTQHTSYEKLSIRVQRFGMMMANKERLVEILKSEDSSRYIEMSQISGLVWHPNLNAVKTEEEFLDLVNQFLTDHFEKAMEQGDEALLEFFEVLEEGVCFESIARSMQKFILPHAEDELAGAISAIADWDTGSSVTKAYNEELKILGQELSAKGESVSPADFRRRLESKGIFNSEFTEESGKQTPTLEGFHEYVLLQIERFTLEPYTIEDFINTEFEIFTASDKEKTVENFRKQVSDRLASRDEPIEVSIDEEEVEFKLDSSQFEAFIGKAVVDKKLRKP